MIGKFGKSCRKAIDDGLCNGDCCGCVPFRKSLLDKHSDKIQKEIDKILPTQYEDEVVVASKDGMCIFLKDDKSCAIYEDRPDVCRRYGLDPALPCPYVNSKGNIRSKAKIKRTQRIIDHKIDAKIKEIGIKKKWIDFMERRKIIKGEKDANAKQDI